MKAFIRSVIHNRALRTAAGAVLAGVLVSIAVSSLITVHNTGASVRNTGQAVAGIHQLQQANNASQNAKDAALQAQVADLQAQVTALEADIQALTGSNAQLAQAVEADNAQLKALGLRPVVEVPASTTTVPASTTTVPRSTGPTSTTTTVPTPPTTKCDSLSKLLGVCR